MPSLFHRKNIRLPKPAYHGHILCFATLCFEHRTTYANNPAVAEWLIAALRQCAMAKSFGIHAYCIMPDHLLSSPKGSTVALTFCLLSVPSNNKPATNSPNEPTNVCGKPSGSTIFSAQANVSKLSVGTFGSTPFAKVCARRLPPTRFSAHAPKLAPSSFSLLSTAPGLHLGSIRSAAPLGRHLVLLCWLRAGMLVAAGLLRRHKLFTSCRSPASLKTSCTRAVHFAVSAPNVLHQGRSAILTARPAVAMR
jgi:hypothetical protein